MRVIAGVFVAFLIPVVSAVTTFGGTLRVAKDGSGDFTVLFDAIEAAASGDTISIAPGRYDDSRWVDLPGGLFEVHGLVTQADLAICGDDETTVFVGPEAAGAGEPFGLLLRVGTTTMVKGITVENLHTGVGAFGEGVTVEDCTFQDCTENGVGSLSLFSTRVLNSKFRRNGLTGIIVWGNLGSLGVEIRGCSFEDNARGIDLQTEGNITFGCLFSGGVVGIQHSFGASGEIQGCTFENVVNVGVGLIDSASANMVGCTFVGGAGQVNVANSSNLSGSDNILSGGTFSTFDLQADSTLDFHDNHILNAGGWSVRVYGGSPPNVNPLDLTDNFWGTTDAAQIAAWIRDVNDFPTIYGEVIYEPFHGGPVKAEAESMGAVKARFAPNN